jgi:hypothetical protein
MTDQSAVSVFVKPKYWDIYRLNVVLMTVIFRKALYIWGTIAIFWLGLYAMLLIHPRPDKDWAIMMQNEQPLLWGVLVLPLLIVFVSPHLAIPRIMRQPRIKDGFRYLFSETGIHVETSVSTSDWLWAAILRVKETNSMFMVFTNPNIASALPKWCFENPQDISVLRELFRTHVKNSQLRSN